MYYRSVLKECITWIQYYMLLVWCGTHELPIIVLVCTHRSFSCVCMCVILTHALNFLAVHHLRHLFPMFFNSFCGWKWKKKNFFMLIFLPYFLLPPNYQLPFSLTPLGYIFTITITNVLPRVTSAGLLLDLPLSLFPNTRPHKKKKKKNGETASLIHPLKAI